MRDLTKWPRLIIVPEPGHEELTREQVNEILLRTNGDYLGGNDRQWERIIGGILGINADDDGYRLDWQSTSDWYRRIAGLDLHYIENSRIYSSWIGGPHGWLDWDGRIGCSTWNIGKWPSYEDVTADFRLIAATFSYLDFHAQLITEEGDGELAGQWRVTGGTAQLVEPVNRFSPDDLFDAGLFGNFFTSGRERGVSEARLIEAAEYVDGLATAGKLVIP